MLAKLEKLCERIEIYRVAEPITLEKINSAAGIIGVELPESYREFLIAINGFYAISDTYELCAISVEDDEDPFVLDSLCGILSDEEKERVSFDLDLVSAQSRYFFRQWAGLPWIVIGTSPSSHFCLDCESKSVYDLPMVTQPPPIEYLASRPPRSEARLSYLQDEATLIATSFEQFFESLEPVPCTSCFG